MGLGIAIKAFAAALFDRQKSQEIERILAGESAGALVQSASPTTTAAESVSASRRPGRDSAITLLAALQRESRLIDLIQEDLGQYSDAQVGSAARPCLQKCAAVLERMFALQPLVDQSDGEQVEVVADASPMRYQWIGERAEGGQPSPSGKLIHHGWQAKKVDLPEWTGSADDAQIVAPAQIQAS